MQAAALTESDIEDERRRKAREITQRSRRLRKSTRENMQAPDFSRQAMAQRIKEAISQQLEASEFLWSLFYAAVRSYRRATIADPWPPNFSRKTESGEERDYDEVELYMKSIPPLASLRESLDRVDNLPQKALSLLDFIVNPWTTDAFKLSLIPVSEYESYVSSVKTSLGRAPSRSPSSKPNLVFKVEYDETSAWYKEFTRMRDTHGYVIAYHGSPLENFHSIIRNGLDDMFSKSSSIYGEGIYLSEDRDVSAQFVKPSTLEGVKSVTFVDQIGCLACCEVVKHPDVRFGSTPENNKYADPGILVDGESQLPQGYVLAQQAEHVLIRYILVYTFSSPRAHKRHHNVCLYLLIIYILCLFFLWLFREKQGARLLSWKHYFSL